MIHQDGPLDTLHVKDFAQPANHIVKVECQFEGPRAVMRGRIPHKQIVPTGKLFNLSREQPVISSQARQQHQPGLASQRRISHPIANDPKIGSEAA
ncbi:MAG: hypothetical protein SOS98_06115 [Varibaculum sp.]|nr:hypothetical protein [Varibaculum sp.]